MSTKLTSFLAVSVVLFGLAACSSAFYSNRIAHGPYASYDERLFDRKLLAEAPALGEIEDLSLRRAPGGAGYHLRLGGDLGLGTLRPDGTVAVDAILPPTRPDGWNTDSTLVKSLSGEVVGILRTSGAGQSHDSYHRPDGSIVWQDKFSAPKTIHGDFDGDGRPEFVQVAGRGEDVYFGVYDNEKNLLWKRKASRYGSKLFVRTTVDDRLQTVLVVSLNNSFIGYDATGRQVLEGTLEAVTDPSRIFAAPCEPDGPEDDCLIVLSARGLSLHGLDGARRLLLHERGAMSPIRFRYWTVSPRHDPVIVVTGVGARYVRLIGGQHRALYFHVFTRSGKLLFYDDIEERGGGMAILPPGAFGGPGGIAVGGDGKIWLYTPNLERWRQRRKN